MKVQIRTHAMHDEAELGVCSHFNYKEGAKTTDRSFNHRLHSLRAVLEHYQERNESSAHKESEDEIENFEHIQDFEGFEKIYVFSRDGDIKELPRDSTVLGLCLSCAYRGREQVLCRTGKSALCAADLYPENR